MQRVRRLGGSVLIACVLAGGLGASTPPAFAGPGTPEGAASLGTFCTYLGTLIARVQAQPQSRLRDFLLAQLLAVQQRYCQ